MNKSESIKGIVAALSKAQAEFPAVPRSKIVTVTSKRTGGKYSFAYAPLEVILGVVRPVLKNNGLAFMQSVSGEALTTLLMHTSGEWIESDPLPVRVDEAGSQALGSAITYARRYALTAALGIVTEDDDDGNAADGNHVEPQRVESGASGAAACKDEYQALSTDAQAEIEDLAFRIRTLLKKKDIRGAYDEIEANGMMRHDDGSMHQENRMALSSRLQSDERAALKKEGERRRTYIDEKAAA